MQHGHRLSRCRGLIEQRGVSNLQTGEIADHGLKVEQRLQTALRYLRLVGRVLGIPARVLKDIAQNDSRGDAVVITKANVALVETVLAGQPPHFLKKLVFG